jgi:hypothetical protein
MGTNVLRQLWHSTMALTHGDPPWPSPVADDCGNELCPSAVVADSGAAPKRRRRKPVKTVRLYPQKPTTAETHVAHLVKSIAVSGEDIPELTRRWIPKEELEKFYIEIATARGWEPLKWTAVGTALAKATVKRRATISGMRTTVYRLRDV